MEKVKKLYVALVVLFLYAPIGVLVAQSFNASRYRGHWTGFTLQWYGELFQNEGILDALQNTITIGLSSAGHRHRPGPSHLHGPARHGPQTAVGLSRRG